MTPGVTGGTRKLKMVHRDPETGQFVSSGGHQLAQSYRDYEFKHVRSHYDVDAADLPGAFPIEEEAIRTVSLDDCLHRDELADLVMLNIHALQASVPGTASAENSLEARWELSLDHSSEMVLGTDQDTGTDGGDSGVIDTAFSESDNPDILFFGEWSAEGGYADSTNQLGGGPDAPLIQNQLNYPAEFGVCPRLDDRDEVVESFRFQDQGGADISDSLIQLSAAYTLVFAVEEADHHR